MNHLKLYDNTCHECSQLITKRYSTSFSLGITMFDKKLRRQIYSIYGFVRFADEIVDTFHQHDKKELLKRFREETFRAIEEKISLNPVLHAFQEVVNVYQIDHKLIHAFLDSMEMDLHFSNYEDSMYKRYIYGSAEVVGLMCLRVFCSHKPGLYEELEPAACALGSAFQKVNFLRDMKSDFQERGRVYFPEVDYLKFDEQTKKQIEADIQADFDLAYQGILQLPNNSRFGVYLAYRYYIKLFKKICKSPASRIAEERIRIPNRSKLYILGKSMIRAQLNMF
jgi:phytoene synthase